MAKLVIGLMNHVFKTDKGYLTHHDAYGKDNLRISLSDIESVSVDGGGSGKQILRINGRGTTLAQIKMAGKWAQKAQDFILKEIKDNEKVDEQPKPASSLDDLERLADLKEKGVITQEEFETKKKQLLGI